MQIKSMGLRMIIFIKFYILILASKALNSNKTQK